MHPVVVTMLFSRKTRDELWLQLNLGEIVCCKPKGKRTIIESLLYLEKIDTIDEILTSKVKISDGDSLLLLEYLVALEKNEESFKELSLKISRCINEAVKNKCITYDSILISLIKSHPPLDLNIADEFLNNGYDFSKFVCEIFPIFFLDLFVYPEEQRKYYLNDVIHAHTNSETNSEFLRYFDESSFQDVNLRLIKKAISFGANPNIQDETKKSALDYARINGIDESIFIVEQKQDVYDFSVDMPPSQKGAILGHIEINGEKVKGSIAKLLIPEGKVASDYQDQKIKVVLTSELQTKQAGEPYYKLDFAP